MLSDCVSEIRNKWRWVEGKEKEEETIEGDEFRWYECEDR
jgi:hypothetical protein